MTRSPLRPALIVAALFAATSCGSSSPMPAAPTPAPGAAPAASFTLSVDKLGSQDAVLRVSEVTVDAGASTGSGLRYLVEFGDGATAQQPVAKHVYDTAGTYRVSVTLTDADGRTATSSRELVVASPLGTWTYGGYLARTRTVEVRTLTLTAQDGATVRGILSRLDTGDCPVTGTLTPDRRVRFSVDRLSETLEGVVPSVLTGDRAPWALAARGGPADGETLSFKPRLAEPTGLPPDSVLKMRFFSFSAPFAIQGISPILFDASGSRGDGLTYFIEFGDGQVATDATATHPIDRAGQYTARLTVVDRFGRWDSEASAFEVRTLVADDWYYWWEGPTAVIRIKTQNGTAITGTLTNIGADLPTVAFTGTADATGNVRLALEDSGISLVGTLSLPWTSYDADRLVLTYAGGPQDGRTITLHFRNYY